MKKSFFSKMDLLIWMKKYMLGNLIRVFKKMKEFLAKIADKNVIFYFSNIFLKVMF